METASIAQLNLLLPFVTCEFLGWKQRTPQVHEREGAIIRSDYLDAAGDIKYAINEGQGCADVKLL